MNISVLLIGDGPFAHHIAKKFSGKGFSIIMTTIEENNVNRIRSLGYIPIYVSNLHEDNCQKIYEQCVAILNDYSLKLKYIVHTARCTFFEPDENDPPEEVKLEMFSVNSKSPELIAKHFYNLGCQFIHVSSCASKGFKRSLEEHAKEKKNGKKIGTHYLKYYSYTKRLGEEGLYNLFKEKNLLSHLSFAYISTMLGTNFFKDMGVPDPNGKGFWNAEQNANYIVDKILEGKTRIYPGWQSKAMMILPRAVNSFILEHNDWAKK